MNQVNRTTGTIHDAAENIYQELEKYQVCERWYGRELFESLHTWIARFNVEFKLNVPKLALRVDALPVNVPGHFRPGRNGFGLEGEITIGTNGIMNLSAWQLLGTLCHECLHGWQEFNGKPSRRDHHNLEFRSKAAKLGLLVDRNGATDYLLDGPFMRLLAAHGVEIPKGAEDEESKVETGRGRIVRRLITLQPSFKGKSKMAKWSCVCGMNVRCARELRAICLDCGHPFVRQSQ